MLRPEPTPLTSHYAQPETSHPPSAHRHNKLVRACVAAPWATARRCESVGTAVAKPVPPLPPRAITRDELTDELRGCDDSNVLSAALLELFSDVPTNG